MNIEPADTENLPTPQELGLEKFKPTAFETFFAEFYIEIEKSHPTWSKEELREYAENAAGHMMSQERLQRLGECQQRFRIWRTHRELLQLPTSKPK